MNKLFSVLTIFLCLIGNTLQLKAQKENIFTNFNNFVKVDRSVDKQQVYLSIVAKEVNEKVKGANYINQQLMAWDYLLVNYTQPMDYDKLEQISDTIILQKTVIQQLSKDSIFNSIVKQYVHKVIDKTQSKDTVSLNSIMNIAVKFFNINKITPEGYYSAKICVGINDIKTIEPKRFPFIEAFAFDIIMENLNNETYNIYPYFVKSIERIYQLNLGIDENERLLRAQGALFIQMLQSNQLKQLLQDEYEKKKAILPFILST